MAEKQKRRVPWGVAIAFWVLMVGLFVLLGSVALQSRRENRPAAQPTPVPTVLVSTNAFLECGNCHQDMDKVFNEGKLPDLTFTHDRHFAIGVSDCSACHVANTHEPDHINKPTMVTCYMCHGLQKDAVAPGACTTCHPPSIEREPASHFQANWLSTEHQQVAQSGQFDCLTCHRQSFCDSCHGLPMPHPSGWAEQPHALAYFQDPQLCDTCHPRIASQRDSCDTCHHPQGPDDVAWRGYHAMVVKDDGAETCFQCHAPATCATCHRKGVESYQADQALLQATATPGTSPSPGVGPSATGSPGGG